MVGTGWAIVITVVVLVTVASIGWIAYSRWQASKLGVRLRPLFHSPPLPFLHKTSLALSPFLTLFDR